MARSQASAPLAASQAHQSGLFLSGSNDGPFNDHPQGQTGQSQDDKPKDDDPASNLSDDEDEDKDMQANNYEDNTLDDDGIQYDGNLLSNLEKVDGYNRLDKFNLELFNKNSEDISPFPDRQKCLCSKSMDTGQYEMAKKVARSKGRPKASDYVEDVQEALDSAISHYKVDLLHWNPYPDCAQELSWSKVSWDSVNKLCGLKITPNGKLMKMVSPSLMSLTLYPFHF